MVDFKARVGKIEGELETFVIQKEKKSSKNKRSRVCHTSHLEHLPVAKTGTIQKQNEQRSIRFIIQTITNT